MTAALRHCAFCNGAIGATWYVSDLGEVTCNRHASPPQCGGCRRVIPALDGLECSRCRHLRVTSTSDVHQAAMPVLQWLTDEIGLHSYSTVPVRLVEQSELPDEVLGETTWTVGGEDLDVDIAIVKGLPRRQFQRLLAHEYGHVMLVANQIDLSYLGDAPTADHVEVEGFCEIVSVAWLLGIADELSPLDIRLIRENPDPVYGDGCRLMHPRFEQAGSLLAFYRQIVGGSVGGRKVPSLKNLPSNTSSRVSPHRPTIPFVRNPRVTRVVPTLSPQQRPTVRFRRLPVER